VAGCVAGEQKRSRELAPGRLISELAGAGDNPFLSFSI
jgi:hypothetical protein